MLYGSLLAFNWGKVYSLWYYHNKKNLVNYFLLQSYLKICTNACVPTLWTSYLIIYLPWLIDFTSIMGIIFNKDMYHLLKNILAINVWFHIVHGYLCLCYTCQLINGFHYFRRQSFYILSQNLNFREKGYFSDFIIQWNF